MNTRQPAPSSETPLGQDLLYALRYYLGGRRAWLALAALAGLGGFIRDEGFSGEQIARVWDLSGGAAARATMPISDISNDGPRVRMKGDLR